MANALTIFRLILIPVIFLLIRDGSQSAVAVFGLAALTDLFDGMVARTAGRVTEFGKMLDPFTDRLLIIASVAALYMRDAFPPLWMLIVMAIRDISLVAGYRILRARGQVLEVTILGKAATATLMISFVLLIMKVEIARWLFYFGFLLYLAAGFIYYLQGKKAFETSR